MLGGGSGYHVECTQGLTRDLSKESACSALQLMGLIMVKGSTST